MAKKRDRKPPRPLEAKTPKGAERCQNWRIRDGEMHQCGNNARKGFRVCWKHGAGSAKREREGLTLNPRTASVTHGKRAKPETREELARNADPAFRALFSRHLNGADLLDFREQIALGKALLEVFVAHAKLSDTDNAFGKVPPALAAIDRLEKVIAVGERALKVEAQLGAITHEELRYYFDVVAETLDLFVPRAKHADARAYLTRRLRERDFGRLGLAAPVDGDGDPE